MTTNLTSNILLCYQQKNKIFAKEKKNCTHMEQATIYIHISPKEGDDLNSRDLIRNMFSST